LHASIGSGLPHFVVPKRASDRQKTRRKVSSVSDITADVGMDNYPLKL